MDRNLIRAKNYYTDSKWATRKYASKRAELFQSQAVAVSKWHTALSAF